ncbi:MULTISPECIES: hypothetical protein [Burkholderia]|uniref:Uncharacterized protein n=1 Tax=Burkholderia sola TaxID=2843302 RepID=A0ABV2CJM3_9BURK|nr:hypothetical protein [Burkholderia sp. CpTa8-5]
MQLNERATHDGSGAPLDDACGSIDNRRPSCAGTRSSRRVRLLDAAFRPPIHFGIRDDYLSLPGQPCIDDTRAAA